MTNQGAPNGQFKCDRSFFRGCIQFSDFGSIYGVALFPLFSGRLEFRSVGFCGRRKPENPAKNPRSRYENKQQTQLNWRQLQNSNPDHIGGRRAFSPLRHPCPLVVGFLLYVARRMNNKRFNFPFRLFLSPFWHKEKLIGR